MSGATEIGKRIRELRGDISQSKLAYDIKMSRGAISYYENGDRTPDAFAIRKLSEYFKVSSDYLLGLTDVKSPDISIQGICEYTGLSEEAIKRLNELNPLDNTLNNQPISSLTEKLLCSKIPYGILQGSLYSSLLYKDLVYFLKELDKFRPTALFYPQDMIESLEDVFVMYDIARREYAGIRLYFEKNPENCSKFDKKLFEEVKKLYEDIRETYEKLRVEQLDIYETGSEIIKEVIGESLKIKNEEA